MLIKSQKLVNTLAVIGLLIFIVSSIIFIGFRITGFAVLNEVNYIDILNLSLNGSGIYFWGLQKQGDLNSVRLSGSIIGSGSVKVYIENEGKKYLLFDNSNPNLITSNVAFNPLEVYNIVNEENLSKNLSQSNQSGFIEENLSVNTNRGIENLSAFLGNISNEIILNISFFNESMENISNTSFLNESFANLTLQNTSNESVFNEDINLTNIGVVQPIYLENVCVETCNLSGFDSLGYNLIFEIEDAVLNINEINYSLKQSSNVTIKEERKQYKAEIGKPVKWIKTVKADQKVDNLIVEIPEESKNITVKKIENKEKINVENINLVTGYVAQNIYNIVSSEKEKKPKKDEEIYSVVDTIFNETNLTQANLTIILVNETNFTITETDINVIEQNESNINLSQPIEILTTEKTNNISLLIQEPVEELEIEYYTEAPQAIENEINDYKKLIIIYSNISYENVLAYTYINETVKEGIKLYWIVNGSRNLFENISYVDENLNGLIERIEWVVPHLSNQTFELELTILNIRSYPTVGGNWNVMFNTTGNANLSIQAVNGTHWNNENENFDLKFLEVKCGNETLNYSWMDNHVLISNYTCNEIGYETSKVISPGVHTLRFDFGDIFAYAYNNASQAPDINFTFPTLANATSTTNTSVEINISITNAADLSEFIWSWNKTNSSFYDNSTVLMFNFDNSSVIGENATYAVDVSKYGNNGTLINGTAWNCTNAKYGCALQFDGVNDYVNLSTSTNLNIPSNITISMWINTKEQVATEHQIVISKVDNSLAATQEWQIVLRGDTGKIRFYGFNPSGQWDRASSSTLSINTWTYFVGVYNGSSMDVYINGNLDDGTLTGTIYSSLRSTTQPIRIGAEGRLDQGLEFNGSIDEVRIWNRSLSTAEIQQHYYSNLYKYATDKWAFYTNQTNLSVGTYTYQGFAADTSGNTNKTDLRFLTIASDLTAPGINFTFPTLANSTLTTNTSVEINISITNASDLAEFIWSWNKTNSSFYDNSTILMFNFDNNSAIGENYTGNGSKVIDISKYGNNGTWVTNGTNEGTLSVWNSTGKYRGAFEFDGKDDYVRTPIINLGSVFTVEFWMNPRLYNYGDPLSAGTNDHWVTFVTYADGSLDYAIGNGSSWGNLSSAVAGTFVSGNWYHVIGTYNGSQSELFINGQSKGAALNSGFSINQVINIGARTATSYYFNGTIDEVRIYNRTLSIAEIQQHYYSNLYKYATDKWAFYINESNITTGTYTYQGFAADTSGNTNKTDSSFLTINPSDILIRNPTNNSVIANTTVHVNYTYGGGITTVLYEVDSNNTNISITLGANITFDNLSKTLHNISIYVNNSANNINSSFVNFSIKSSIPDLRILNPTNNTNYSISIITLNYSSVDVNPDKIWYELDSNNTNVTITTNLTFSGLSEGYHNVTMWDNDTANNQNRTFVSFFIDTVNPDLRIINPINNTLYQTATITLNYSSRDLSLDKIWYELDSNNTNITTTTNLTFGLSLGEHNITLWNNDTTNNKNRTYIQFTLESPPVPPDEGGGGTVPPEIPVIPPIVPPVEPPVIPPIVTIEIPTITMPSAGESLTGARKECLNITGLKKEEADLLSETSGLEFCKEEKLEKIEVKAKSKCNGIEIDVNDLVFLQASIYDKKAKLSLDIGINKTEGKYCPWCYNNKQDYDEIGIDCGGSCKSCVVEEIPSEIPVFKREKDLSFLILFLFFVIAGSLIIKEEEKIGLRKVPILIKVSEAIRKPEIIAEVRPRAFRTILIEELTEDINKLNLMVNNSYNNFNLKKIKQAVDEYYSSLSLYEKTKENLVIDERELIENKLKLLKDRVEISDLLNQIKNPIEKYKKEHIKLEKQRALFRDIKKLKENIWSKEFGNHEKIFYNLLRINSVEEAGKFLVKIIRFYNQIKLKLTDEKRAEFSDKIGLMLMKRKVYTPIDKYEKVEFKPEKQKPEIREFEARPYIKTEAEKLLDNIHKLLKENKYFWAINVYSKLSVYRGNLEKFKFKKLQKPEIEKRIFQKQIISEQEEQFNSKIIGFYKEIRSHSYKNALNFYNQSFDIYNHFDQAKRQKYENRIKLLELTKEAYRPIKEHKKEEFKEIKVKEEKRSIILESVKEKVFDKDVGKLRNLIKENDCENALLLLNSLWKS